MGVISEVVRSFNFKLFWEPWELEPLFPEGGAGQAGRGEEAALPVQGADKPVALCHSQLGCGEY